jgi:hypothetical protein
MSRLLPLPIVASVTRLRSPVAGSILSSSELKTVSVEPFLTSHAFSTQTNGSSAATLS